jgi:hypothetical protein
MKRRLGSLAVSLLVLAAGLIPAGCATLDQLASTFVNLKRLEFRIGQVTSFRLAGIDLGRTSALSQLTPFDALALAGAYASRRLPAEIVVEVEALNPNDGTAGTPRTTSTLTSLECRLLVDGRPTVTGNIDRAFEIPGTGEAAVVPIRLSLDLYEFFGEKRYGDLVDLALALGGARRDTSRISLDAQPTVTTPLGNITYPGRITIVGGEYR